MFWMLAVMESSCVRTVWRLAGCNNNTYKIREIRHRRRNEIAFGKVRLNCYLPRGSKRGGVIRTLVVFIFIFFYSLF